jgi:hypothetical protein
VQLYDLDTGNRLPEPREHTIIETARYVQVRCRAKVTCAIHTLMHRQVISQR